MQLGETSSDVAVFGVWDGHGGHGHHVSELVSKRLPPKLFAAAAQFAEKGFEAPTRTAHDEVERELEQANFDFTAAGCTSCVVSLVGRQLLM